MYPFSNCHALCLVIFIDQFSSKSRNLEDHKLGKHTKNTLQLICELCGYSTPVKSKLMAHIRTKHEVDKFKQCPYCAHRSFSQAKICIHIDGKHPEQGEKKFFCDGCTNGYIFEHSLKHHKRMSHNEKRKQKIKESYTSGKYWGHHHVVSVKCEYCEKILNR